MTDKDSMMMAWSSADLLTFVGSDQVYILDASGGPVPLPPWLLAAGAVELKQSIGERLELVHPDDRSIPGDMFLSAIVSPGEVISGEYRIRADGRWLIRSTRMVNLLGGGLLDGIVVAGTNTVESTIESSEAPSPRLHGEFTRANWLVQILNERATILEIDGMVDEILGRSPSELIGSSAIQLLAPECFASAAVMWADLMANPGATASARQRVVRPDGSSLWIDSFFVSRLELDGSIRVMNFVNDVTEQREQQMAIEQLAEEFRSLAEQVPAAIFRCDRFGTVSFHNELWESLCPSDSGVRRLHDLIHRAAHGELDAELTRLAIATDAQRETQLELRGAQGTTMLSLKLRAVGRHGSEQVTFVGSIEDITSTMTLRHRAIHDPLTGLMNREGLTAYLSAAMAEYPDELLIGFVDLDGFKNVNDRFGHETGDRVLASIAERFRRAFRSVDVVARFGGDEFVVVCRAQAGTSDGMVTSAVERALAEPVVWDGGCWNAKASIGIARFEPDDDVVDLLRRADRNMYLAKAEHRLEQAAS